MSVISTAVMLMIAGASKHGKYSLSDISHSTPTTTAIDMFVAPSRLILNIPVLSPNGSEKIEFTAFVVS